MNDQDVLHQLREKDKAIGRILEHNNAELARKLAEKDELIARIMRTKSWRWTRPLRSLGRMVHAWKRPVPPKEERVHLPSVAAQNNPHAFTVCTIITKKQLPSARVLAAALRAHHPETSFIVLLADRLEHFIDPSKESFTLLTIDVLAPLDAHFLCFRHTEEQLHILLKPLFLEYILRCRGAETVLFLDPDAYVTSPLSEILRSLAEHNVVLPSTEKNGASFNPAFMLLRSSQEARNVLQWYTHQHEGHARSSLASLQGVTFLEHPGYAIGCTNFQNHAVERRGDQWTVDGAAMAFFHFGGFDPDQPQRIFARNHRSLLPLVEDYTERLIEAGYNTCVTWPRAYDVWSNGVHIPPFIRAYHRSLRAEARRFGDPFDKEHAGSLYQWLQTPRSSDTRDSGYTNAHDLLYHTHPDIHAMFPNVPGSDMEDFLAWVTAPEQEQTYQMDAALFLPQRSLRTLFPRWKQAANSWALETMKKELPPGLNISGYITGENSIGEAVRRNIRAASAAEIPRVFNCFDVGLVHTADGTYANDCTKLQPYSTNLMHINADQVPVFLEHMGGTYIEGRRTIAYWVWELPVFPQQWHRHFQHFQEIWTPSEYSAQALRAASPIPVRTLMHPVEGVFRASFSKAMFGIPEDVFLFFFMFDALSVVERKNPIAVIEAFKQAFRPDEPAMLILKFTNGFADPLAISRLFTAGQGYPVLFLDQHMSAQEVESLLHHCDAYVSLHRAEGFGMTIADAMASSKPVIATNYSGNAEYMTEKNSFPVRYTLVELQEDYGPYTKGNVWAEPDIKHAAELMRRVYDDREHALRVARRGALELRSKLSPRRIGMQMKELLPFS